MFFSTFVYCKYIMKIKYPNTIIFLTILVAMVLFSDNPAIARGLHIISTGGYLGIFLSGMFYVSSFTVVPATFVLINLTEYYSTFTVAVIAGFGGLIGDLLIFRFMKDGLFDELKKIFFPRRFFFPPTRMQNLLKRYINPILGLILIASPLPDEVGVALMGFSNIKLRYFSILVFTLNTIGIYFVLSLLG